MITPLQMFEDELLPVIRESLKCGQESYGDMWAEDLRPTAFENVEHVVNIHVIPNLLKAIEDADYGQDIDMCHHFASAVGYLAVIMAKCELIAAQDML